MNANHNSVDVEMSVSLEKLHDFFKLAVVVWAIVWLSGKDASGFQES